MMLVILLLRHTPMGRFFTAEEEFEIMGHNGHTMLISKVLYGLKTSEAQWHEKFSETKHQFVFSPLKAYHEVWTKDEGDNYSHICVYVDGMIY